MVLNLDACKSRKAFLRAIQANQSGQYDSRQTGEKHQWSNIDLDPTPPHERTWGPVTYLAFWLSFAADSISWTAGSATIALGIKWWHAYIALNIAHIIITYMIVIAGRGPARYHIGFPVMARLSYGVWGSYMAVFRGKMRATICIVWNGVNSYYGGRLVSVAITCIWPRWKTLPNHLPESAGISSTDLGAVFIFWFVFQCMTVIHARDMKYFYWAKAILVFICMHGVLIWWMVVANGSLNTSYAKKQQSASTQGWLFMQAFNTGLGVGASLTVNQGDIARYATSPRAQFWPQLVGFPIASSLPILYGILVASASQVVTGTAFWNLWDVLDYMFVQYEHNPGARFLLFFCSGSLALSYIGINLATNCLPFGSDMSALFPKWMTIRRGQFICCALGIVICPWKILVSASTFVAFLSGYGYWMAPIAAIMMVDYYFVKNGNVDVPHLYTGSPSGRYWYYKGWNSRAVVVTVVSLVPCLPSFASTIATHDVSVSTGAEHMFFLSFLLTYIIATVMYYLSYIVFPEKPGIRVEAPREAYADMYDQQELDGRTSTRDTTTRSSNSLVSIVERVEDDADSGNTVYIDKA
ncbi:hypothetical protein ACEPAF_380 [Sanghuangporus sanghuang]